MSDSSATTHRYCGRLFTADEMEQIRALIAFEPKRNRAQLSRLACDQLGWLTTNGRRKEMSCRVAMLRMHRDGLIRLPPPQKGNANGHHRPRATAASDPPPRWRSDADWRSLEFRPVQSQADSALWNELIQRYHYLKYKPLPGAQIRYMVFSGPDLLAVLGFGAAAWTLAPRDRLVGWTAEQRQHNLHRVVNNARFLILPWIRSQNLASRILSGVVKQLPKDWRDRYRYAPVLLETFVEQSRFRGTCYRAANWLHVGQTQGRGKLDRENRYALPVKDIFLYPLHKHFTRQLCQLP